MWPKKKKKIERERLKRELLQISISDDYRSWLALQRGGKNGNKIIYWFFCIVILIRSHYRVFIRDVW